MHRQRTGSASAVHRHLSAPKRAGAPSRNHHLDARKLLFPASLPFNTMMCPHKLGQTRDGGIPRSEWPLDSQGVST